MSTADDRINGHPLAYSRMVNAVTYRLDHTIKLVANHARVLCKWIMTAVNMAV